MEISLKPESMPTLCRSAFLPADTTITRRVAATIEVASSVVHRKEYCFLEIKNNNILPDPQQLTREPLGPFHTARVMPTSALILRAPPRKGILFTQRGPSQTNCYCFQWSLSYGASARAKCSSGAPLVGQAPAPVQRCNGTLLSMHIFTRAV